MPEWNSNTQTVFLVKGATTHLGFGSQHPYQSGIGSDTPSGMSVTATALRPVRTETVTSNTLWWRLKERRLDLGIGTVEAAEMCGTTQPTYSRWENRKRVPEDPDLAGIARFLGVKRADVVLFRSGEDPSEFTTEEIRELREHMAELAEELKLLRPDSPAEPTDSSS